MITLIEASNYRCLRYISQPLSPFHILIGPNASGKTTFLDVISFLSHLASSGLENAIDSRVKNFNELTWHGNTERFELAIEAKIPELIQNIFKSEMIYYDTIRYEVAIGIDKGNNIPGILEEKVILKPASFKEIIQKSFFPMVPEFTPSLITKTSNTYHTVVKKVRTGNDYFVTEFKKKTKKSWQYAFKLGTQKSALGNLPSDESQFPATSWLRYLLSDGVQQFVLNSLKLRMASPPGQIKGFKPDGSNLPWVIEDFKNKDPLRFANWISHLQSALPDVLDIRTIEREDDHNRYILLKYKDGLEIPSWVISDGTLRMLALTLPAYLPELDGVFLIEEPENGIHPKAIQSVYQSLSSVYDAQILLATHSPVILGISETKNVLCFAKNQEGATDIVSGDMHPALAKWQGETNLGVLFASGVLG